MRRGLRPWVAVGASRVASGLSRLARQGRGSAIGGAVAQRIDPEFMEHMGAGRRIVFVTGTNGKSTTSSLLAAAVSMLGPTAFNNDGSNMANGVAAALARQPNAPFAVLEVDEPYVFPLAARLHPEVIVLLNLSRESTRGNRLVDLRSDWNRGLLEQRNWPLQLVANADDPLVVSAVPDGVPVVWVGTGGDWS
ncbi:MAG: Mur ligase family protein, partial [Actinomycetes bacterium]